jgi:cytochrome c oxidase subunit II
MTERAGRALRMALLGALAPAIAACLPNPVTDEGRDTQGLYMLFMAAAAVVATIVIGLTTWAVLRYRARDDDPLPRQTRGNTRLEVAWTALPALTIAALFVATVTVLARVDDTERPAGVEIDVTGFRWGWSFSYPANGVTVSGVREPGPEVYVPVGEPILLRLTAADVEHAFFVPRFLFKRDLIPGRENRYEFTVREAGVYGGQCAEYCGLYHARMPFTIHAVSRGEFDAWLTAQPAASPPAGSPPAGSAPASPDPAGSGG